MQGRLTERARVLPASLALAACLVLGQAAVAGAQEVVQSRPHQYRLALPAGWTDASAAGPAMVSGHRHEPSGARLAITRVDYPNPAAWQQEAAFFEQVEDGVRAAAPGYARLHRRQLRLGRVPAMDLSFRRRTGDGAEVVHMRFLFFRRYTLALALAAPARAHRRHGREHRALVDSFVPSFGD
jgi:hypothetical protein